MTRYKAAGTGLESFWGVLWSGAWVANVGIPVLVAGTGLVIAVCLVNRQLKASRDLAAAELRQLQAQRFAQSIYDAANSLRDFSQEVRDTNWQCPPDGAYTKLSRMMDPLLRATLRARSTIGSSHAVADVSRFEQSLRNRFQRAALEHSAKAKTKGYSDQQIHIALAYLLDQYVSHFEITAENIEDWDGRSDLPVSAARQPQLPVSMPTEVGTICVGSPPNLILGESDEDHWLFETVLEKAKKSESSPFNPTQSPAEPEGS